MDNVYDQRLTVAFDFPVIFTRQVFAPGNAALVKAIERKGGARPHRVIAFLDTGVATLAASVADYFAAHRSVAKLVLPPQVTAGGEGAKSGWEQVRQIMTTLGEQHLCRHSVVVVVGGGGVLDMVGFAASLVHRGLRVVRVPTTVLGQNDAGVGVKTGMNEHGQKNFIGTFAPPFAVLNDVTLLTTLPNGEWVGGIAEAFKVALIKDAAFFDWLCGAAGRLRARDLDAMEQLIRRCAELHLDHIRNSGDPFEQGSARPLDFGHWSAHRMECLSGFKLGHGQAVAVGLALDGYYASRQGFITEADLERLLRGLTASGLPVWHELLERPEILDGLEQFREHLGGRLTLAMPDGVGRLQEINDVDRSVIADGIRYLKSWRST
jgi:3-dehydroquinate synthase